MARPPTELELIALETEFSLYLPFAKRLVLTLPEHVDRIRAAQWLQKLRGIEDNNYKKLRNEYTKLMLFALHRRSMVGLFQKPPPKEELESFHDGLTLLEMTRELIEEMEREKTAGKGDECPLPPVKTNLSYDLTEYAALQMIPKFGAHVYYAVSKQPIQYWKKPDNNLFPGKGDIPNSFQWEDYLAQITDHQLEKQAYVDAQIALAKALEAGEASEEDVDKLEREHSKPDPGESARCKKDTFKWRTDSPLTIWQNYNFAEAGDAEDLQDQGTRQLELDEEAFNFHNVSIPGRRYLHLRTPLFTGLPPDILERRHHGVVQEIPPFDMDDTCSDSDGDADPDPDWCNWEEKPKEVDCCAPTFTTSSTSNSSSRTSQKKACNRSKKQERGVCHAPSDDKTFEGRNFGRGYIISEQDTINRSASGLNNFYGMNNSAMGNNFSNVVGNTGNQSGCVDVLRENNECGSNNNVNYASKMQVSFDSTRNYASNVNVSALDGSYDYNNLPSDCDTNSTQMNCCQTGCGAQPGMPQQQMYENCNNDCPSFSIDVNSTQLNNWNNSTSCNGNNNQFNNYSESVSDDCPKIINNNNNNCNGGVSSATKMQNYYKSNNLNQNYNNLAPPQPIGYNQNYNSEYTNQGGYSSTGYADIKCCNNNNNNNNKTKCSDCGSNINSCLSNNFNGIRPAASQSQVLNDEFRYGHDNNIGSNDNYFNETNNQNECCQQQTQNLCNRCNNCGRR